MSVFSTTNASILTVVVGMLGIVLGTFLSPYLNNRLNIHSRRKELFFNKRLEYFEEIAKNMESNIKMYNNHLSQFRITKNKKELNRILGRLKEERKKFHVSASPLYFDTRKLSKRIIIFINFEKRIFFDINQLSKSRDFNEKIVNDIELNLERLKKAGTEVIHQIKKEIYRTN